MSFRAELLRRAAGRKARIVLCEGNDARVRAAAERLGKEGIAQPIVLGDGAIDPSKDPRLGRVAQHLRDRRPDRILDGVHALDVGAMPTNFGAALVALFFAWRRIYRPAQACKPGDVCAIPQVRATYKLIFWVVAALVLVALGFPYVMPFFY